VVYLVLVGLVVAFRKRQARELLGYSAIPEEPATPVAS
jgi:hypothetical protein